MTAIQQVEKLHHNLLKNYPEHLTVFDVLENQAQTLCREHRRQNTAVCVQIGNWHPTLAGARRDEILQAVFTIEDARITVTRQHGFQDWPQVESQGAAKLDRDFKRAVDTMALLISSAHPAEAGLAEQIAAVLEKAE